MDGWLNNEYCPLYIHSIYVPGTLPGAEDTAVNKARKKKYFLVFTFYL